MHLADEDLLFFATDLSNFLACPQLTLLNRRAALGGPKPPYFDDPGADVLRERGLQHEQAFLERLRANGRTISEIADLSSERSGSDQWRALSNATVDAMRSGADVVYQGALFDAPWGGKPDFLLKVSRPSTLGHWSYEVIDTKLAREAKGGALLQVLLYAYLLEKTQGVAPECVHLALGGPEQKFESFPVADYAAYFRSVKHRFETVIANAPAEIRSAPDPVEHCGICVWSKVCDDERHAADHLSLIAGISAGQRRALVERSIIRLEAFAQTTLPITPKLDGVTSAGVERIHGQALIQLQGRREKKHKYQLLTPVVEKQGLAALPKPNPGDLFLDLEGDPYAHTYGIEYLFGYADMDRNYAAKWALNPGAEKLAFEEFVDFVTARLEQHPGMHIYHYNHYEPTQFKRLMGRYGTREDQIDRLLRGEVFVDLYRVVRQGLRASVESYSIKMLEPFYNYTRDVDLAVANRALATFTAFIELGIERHAITPLLEEIEGYNRDDCISTLRLRDWLEERRGELAALMGHEIPRPAPANPEPDEDLAERLEVVARLVALLTADMVAAPERGTDAYARWLLAQLLEFHRREKKQYWWDYFRIRDLSDEERFDERKTIVGLEFVGEVPDLSATRRSRSKVYRYRYPPQEQSFDVGDRTDNPVGEEFTGTVAALDPVACTIDLKRAGDIEHPSAIMLDDYIDEKPMKESLLRFARFVAEAEADKECYLCALDLLHARGRPSSVLAIQGPPGSGKTHTGAHMILEALAKGKRVGVTANSHKVIGNLLRKVCTEAAKNGVAVTGIQKCEEGDWCGRAEIEPGGNPGVRGALATGAKRLAAGTAWLWSREDMVASVDVLFIDEAGQISLANALAVAPAAKELVLLGDPQQLDQPLQGVHPPGVAVSALGHMLGDHATMPRERGVFLDQTWRLHPSICAFTSELFYESKLDSRAGMDAQEVGGVGLLAGNGIRLVPVAHVGNTNESVEEAEAVAQLVEELLATSPTWTDADGAKRMLTLEDVVIVAPYNMQVSAIARRLPAARVGTVDKFQGQEAPISIYSMATSSAADAPRGMKFLYSPNRFNVATSRAKCIAVVVAGPDLFMPDCRTPEQMKLANAFCRFAELARPKDECRAQPPGNPTMLSSTPALDTGP
jgi:predicted RecB family nuclease